MGIYEIKGSFEDSEKHATALEEHAASRTRGAVLHDIVYVAHGDEAGISGPVGKTLTFWLRQTARPTRVELVFTE
ncbi:hypothetical protein [Rhizobium mongolense]|uniref:hypothetical protein n=1 Tax=Rhizobium mongolense TaxID=57676 RepID=UPI0034A48F3C